MISLKKLEVGRSILRDLTIIALCALLVRICLFFLFDYQKDLNGGDSSYYLETGRNIVEYGVHGANAAATFFRPPLYSLFAGIVSSISKTAAFFYVTQSILFISFSIAVYFLIRQYGDKLAFMSALLIAISPFDVLMNGRVLSENLVTPLLVLGTLCFVNSNHSKVRFFVSGCLLGGVALSRDIYLLFPVFLLVAGFCVKISWRHLAIFLFGFALLVAPWVYRNSQMPSGGLFLSKGILWTNIWVGVWERNADWTRMPNPYVLPAEAFVTVDAAVSPAIVIDAFNNGDEEFFRKVTINYVLSHPLKVIYTWAMRYPLLWFGTRSDLNTSYLIGGRLPWYFMKVVFYLINALLVVFAALGMFVAMRTRKLPLLLCLPVIYNALIYIPFHNVETRYSLPVMPILSIYFSFFLLYVLNKWRRGVPVGRIA